MAEATKEYEVTADGQLFLKFNDKGDVIEKKRLRRGDTVALTEEQANRLLSHNGVKAKDEDEAKADEADATAQSEPGDAPARIGVGGGGEVFPPQGFSADTDDDGADPASPEGQEVGPATTNAQPDGTVPEGSADEALSLRGEALDQALIDADLSTSGSADERRQRLYNHRTATA